VISAWKEISRKLCQKITVEYVCSKGMDPEGLSKEENLKKRPPKRAKKVKSVSGKNFSGRRQSKRKNSQGGKELKSFRA
jgi:hypothetical protein